MTLKVILKTAEFQAPRAKPRINLELGGTALDLIMPPAGVATAHQFPPLAETRLLRGLAQAKPGPMAGSLDIDGEEYSFSFGSVAPDDVLLMEQVTEGTFYIKLNHFGQMRECRAVCPDGSSGQPCVDCLVNGVTFRVCC